MRLIVCCSATLIVALGSRGVWSAETATAPAIDDVQRLALYQRFRGEFDAQQYRDALSLAEQLVKLTELQYGADAAALINPLTNLGTVQLRLGNYAAAEPPYQRAVRLIDARSGSADHRLIRPLQGLGETWFAARRYSAAAAALKRAVDLSRNLDGLFNVEQLPIVITLIDAYMALDQHSDAEKEQQYAFRVAESNYGTHDLRMLEPLDRYARWFEYNGRNTSARAVHGRALQLAEQLTRAGSLQTVTPLRGIARTYFHEFLLGTEKEPAPQETDPFSPVAPLANDVAHLNGDGEKALRMAVTALTQNAPVDTLTRGDTLTELADWYLVSGAAQKARDTYRLAWLDFASVQQTQRLAAPRQLVYRPPVGSVARSRPSRSAEWDERAIEMQFRVSRDGEVSDPRPVSANAPQDLVKAIASALRKALYAPRVEAGQVEDSADVRYIEHMLVRKPRAADKPARST